MRWNHKAGSVSFFFLDVAHRRSASLNNQKWVKTWFSMDLRKRFLKWGPGSTRCWLPSYGLEEFDLSAKSSDLIHPTPLGPTGPWARALDLSISVWPHRCSPGWMEADLWSQVQHLFESLKRGVQSQLEQHVVVLHRQPLRRLYTLYLSVSHEWNQCVRGEVVEWVGDGLINQWTCKKEGWMDGRRDGWMEGGTWWIRLRGTAERKKTGRDSPIKLW